MADPHPETVGSLKQALLGGADRLIPLAERSSIPPSQPRRVLGFVDLVLFYVVTGISLR